MERFAKPGSECRDQPPSRETDRERYGPERESAPGEFHGDLHLLDHIPEIFWRRLDAKAAALKKGEWGE
jgi:hypothetical protein